MRYQDYSRYKQFCTRKIYRLRRSAKMLNGRKRFKACGIPEIVSDSRVLEILLFSAERAWVHAMELKSAASNAESNISTLEHHSARRFAKAAKWAALLNDTASRCADSETMEECRAYYDLMVAESLIEAARYQDASAPLVAARSIISKLSVLRKLEAYKARLDSLDPLFRTLKFHTNFQAPAAIAIDTQAEAVVVSTRKAEIEQAVRIASEALDVVNRAVTDGSNFHSGIAVESGFKAGCQIIEEASLLALLPSAQLTRDELNGLKQLGLEVKALFIACRFVAMQGKTLEAYALLDKVRKGGDSVKIGGSAEELDQKLKSASLKLRVLIGSKFLSERPLDVRAQSLDADMHEAEGEEDYSPMSSGSPRAIPQPQSVGLVGKLTGWFRR